MEAVTKARKSLDRKTMEVEARESGFVSVGEGDDDETTGERVRDRERRWSQEYLASKGEKTEERGRARVTGKVVR